MKLPGAVPCRSGCGQDVVVLPERGGRRVPFDADLVAAADDRSGLGYLLVRERGTRTGTLVPVTELPDRLLEGAWRIMRHRCEEFAGLRRDLDSAGDVVRSL